MPGAGLGLESRAGRGITLRGDTRVRVDGGRDTEPAKSRGAEGRTEGA